MSTPIQEENLAMVLRDKIFATINELDSQPNVTKPSFEELRAKAIQYGVKTQWGNYAFYTSVRNRSAGVTVYVGNPSTQLPKMTDVQKKIIANVPQTLEKVFAYLKKVPLIKVQRSMGDNTEFAPDCTLFLSVARPEWHRLGLFWGYALPEVKGTGYRQYIIDLPEWQEKDRQVIMFAELNVTFVLGSDYYGEIKKGFLRNGMFQAKRKGMLGLHAGSKTCTGLSAKDGKLKTFSMLLFGLSGTGKTTHSCHDHLLDSSKGEGVKIYQDDIVFWKEDGSALGTETGFFIKTDGVEPVSQKVIWDAGQAPGAVWENVTYDYKGHVDFEDQTITGNGRGIVLWKDLGERQSETINIPPVKDIDGLAVVFITRRNTILPMISKLTFEQAAAQFLLGESIETAAGDPKKAGQSVREPGFNPFIVGNPAEEANIFLNFCRKLGDKVQCYLINTGGVGEVREELPEGGTKLVKKCDRISILDNAAMFRGIVRESIEWIPEPLFNTLVPKEVPDTDLVTKYAPSKYYSQEDIEKMRRKLIDERIEYLEFYEKRGLDKDIVDSIRKDRTW